MKEEYLSYVWKNRLWDKLCLQSTDGEDIIVQSIGEYNPNGGPDYLQARIHIGGCLWVGNVEIHTNSSDWDTHQHQQDAAYNNVILHVVYRHNKEVYDKNNRKIPTLEMSKIIAQETQKKFQKLRTSKQSVPCAAFLTEINAVFVQDYYQDLVVERLESKMLLIENIMQKNQNDWEATFYTLLLKSMGLKINAYAMEILSVFLPFKVVRKHFQNPLQLSALFFGVAGFLQKDFQDEYPRTLQKEFAYLQQKYQLQVMEVSIWKFLRLRPASFPTIRIAQLVSIFLKNQSWVAQLLASNSVHELKKLFEISPNQYWENHYVFDNPSEKQEKRIGDATLDIILINAVVPLLYSYEKMHAFSHEKSLVLMQKIPAERNKITKKFKDLGMPLLSALHSQATIQLFGDYCTPKKCLSCRLGNQILRNA